MLFRSEEQKFIDEFNKAKPLEDFDQLKNLPLPQAHVSFISPNQQDNDQSSDPNSNQRGRIALIQSKRNVHFDVDFCYKRGNRSYFCINSGLKTEFSEIIKDVKKFISE